VNRSRRRILLLIGALALSSCTGQAAAGPTSRAHSAARTSPSAQRIAPPAGLTAPGTLTFLSDTTYPPQESIDPGTNRAVGFDIDVADAISQRMGLTTTIVSTDYGVIIPTLLAHKGDAAISAIAITPDLESRVAFVGYFESGQAILVRKGNPAGVVNLADLCGKRVGVQVTTSEEDTLTAENGSDCASSHIDIQTRPTDTNAVDELKAGQLDAVLDDSPVADSFVSADPNDLEIAGPPVHLGVEGIAVDPKNGDVLHAIREAMLAIYEDGTYHQILLKWNLLDGEIPASQIIVTPSPSSTPPK
jgi:polar amino acid transport system substrate-binding protein